MKFMLMILRQPKIVLDILLSFMKKQKPCYLKKTFCHRNGKTNNINHQHQINHAENDFQDNHIDQTGNIVQNKICQKV